ncbi:MAG: hypothetical protein J0M11_13625 [Anaerolineae bacterium]|nr:hypothetical protein [Anaerolineae bacterium]
MSTFSTTRRLRHLRFLFFILLFLVTLACDAVTPGTSSPTPYSSTVIVNTPTPDTRPIITPIKGSAGSTIIPNGDGSTLFVDERAGYSITIPAGWLAIRANEQEYLDAFSLPQTADEMFQRSLKSIQNKDPNINRLFVMDLMDGHSVKDLVTNVNIVWDEPFEISLNDEVAFQKLTDETAAARSGLTITSADVIATSQGEAYGKIQMEIEGFSPSGEAAVSQITLTVFDLPTGTLYISLTTESSLAETVHPIFTNMLDTFMLEPK